MDYIINPWWFYLIGVLNAINVISTFGILLGLVGTMTFGFVYRSRLTSSFIDTEIRCSKNIFKLSLVCFCISALFWILIPSESTMNKMLIANVLTKQNIEAGTDFTQDQIDKLVDKIADAAVKVKASDKK